MIATTTGMVVWAIQPQPLVLPSTTAPGWEETTTAGEKSSGSPDDRSVCGSPDDHDHDDEQSMT